MKRRKMLHWTITSFSFSIAEDDRDRSSLSLRGPFCDVRFILFPSSSFSALIILFGWDLGLEPWAGGRATKQCRSSQNSFFRSSPHRGGCQTDRVGGRSNNIIHSAVGPTDRHNAVHFRSFDSNHPVGRGQNRQQRKSKTPSSILTVALWVWRRARGGRRGWRRPSNHLSLPPPPSSRHPPPSPSFSHLLLMVFTLQIYHPPSPYNNLDGPRSLYVCMYYGNPRS